MLLVDEGVGVLEPTAGDEFPDEDPVGFDGQASPDFCDFFEIGIRFSEPRNMAIVRDAGVFVEESSDAACASDAFAGGCLQVYE